MSATAGVAAARLRADLARKFALEAYVRQRGPHLAAADMAAFVDERMGIFLPAASAFVDALRRLPAGEQRLDVALVFSEAGRVLAEADALSLALDMRAAA